MIKLKQLIRLLPGFLFCHFLLLWLTLFKKRSSKEAKIGRKKVLIVKLDAIGDFVVWLDVAKELRKIYPPAEFTITLLGNSQWTDLAKRLDYFDDVWSIDRAAVFVRFANYFELMEKMCNVEFDVVLHPVFSREFLFGDWFVWISDARLKIGMQGDGANLNPWLKHIGNICYTNLISVLNGYDTELEHNAQFLRWLGISDFEVSPPLLQIQFERPVNHLPADYYVIIPGAGGNIRRWPVSNFIELIEKVYALTGISTVICGGHAEEELGKIIELGTSAPLINLIGQTSITELASIISEARFMVGNETGAIHIASAVRASSICIIGGGHYGRFIPYHPYNNMQNKNPVPVFNRMDCFGCNWECIYSIQADNAAPCVEQITLDSVFSAVIVIDSK